MVTHFTGSVFASNAPAIAHQVNCKGVMGGGVALQVRQKYPSVFTTYKAACKKLQPDQLMGTIQPCLCGGFQERWIINCFAQDGFGTDKQYTDYEALEKCFRKMRRWAIERNVEKIAFPYGIGCGLGGGDWTVIHDLLKKVFYDSRVTAEVWQLPEKNFKGGYRK